MKPTNESLEQSSLSYKDALEVLESITEPFYALDSHWRFTFINQKAQELLGYNREAIIGKNIWETFPKSVGSQTYHEMHRVQTERVKARFETFSFYLKIWTEVQIFPTATGISVYFQDISPRKLAEISLRESEEKYRRIVETAQEGIWIIDVDNHTTFVNDAMAGMLGYTVDEMLGTSLFSFMDADSLAIASNNVDRREQGIAEQHEFKFRRKDGQMVWTLISTNPLTNQNGDYIGVLAMVADITARKLAEEAQSRLVAIVKSSSDAIVSKTLDGIILSWNAGAERIFGYSAQEAIGQHISLIIPVERWDEEIEILRRIQQAETVEAYETVRRRKDGSHVVLSVAISPVKDMHGAVIGASKIARDITQQKNDQAEIMRLNAELEQKVVERTLQLTTLNRELESFNYSVSHDLRAPLRAIDGFSLALLEDFADNLTDSGRHYLQRIRLASQRMGNIIDALLKLSRLSRQDMQKTRLNVSALVSKIVESLEEIEPIRQVEWVIQTHVMTWGDENLLKIVLENLVGNAWKFTNKTPHAKIEFGITTHNEQIVYYVRDNGVGFDMTYADKLFGAFQRLHAVSEFEGTGIGLATVQRIVHRHHGAIWAEGYVGQGATFYFTLPSEG